MQCCSKCESLCVAASVVLVESLVYCNTDTFLLACSQEEAETERTQHRNRNREAAAAVCRPCSKHIEPCIIYRIYFQNSYTDCLGRQFDKTIILLMKDMTGYVFLQHTLLCMGWCNFSKIIFYKVVRQHLLGLLASLMMFFWQIFCRVYH